MAEYELVAGIETHVQLRTKTKLFCPCSTTYGAPPNSQTCPVCLGLPGCLPVLNAEALRLAVRGALALGCRIAPFTKFDRKNYYYPDLPKNYQISQYDLPLSADGGVEIEVDGARRTIGIQRAHMEEDAGKLLHDAQTGRSYVDLNRTGLPLLEIVTRPDFRSVGEVVEYLSTLKAILRYAGVSECDMEKGELRCDVNLSLRPKGATALGVKTEIKNVNSFKFIAQAIEYEVGRQTKVLDAGGRIEQATLLFDSERKVTELMRTKEEAHDYRYFPEPDLLPLRPDAKWIDEVRREVPELPLVRRDRFRREHGLSPYDAGVLVAERDVADFFEETARLLGNSKAAANWVTNEVLKAMNERGRTIRELALTPAALAELIRLVEARTITGAVGKQLLAEIAEKGGSPAGLVASRGLAAVSDEAELSKLMREVLAANPKVVEDVKGGKEAARKFLIGQGMRASKGKANPQALAKILDALLK